MPDDETRGVYFSGEMYDSVCVCSMYASVWCVLVSVSWRIWGCNRARVKGRRRVRSWSDKSSDLFPLLCLCFANSKIQTICKQEGLRYYVVLRRRAFGLRDTHTHITFSQTLYTNARTFSQALAFSQRHSHTFLQTHLHFHTHTHHFSFTLSRLEPIDISHSHTPSYSAGIKHTGKWSWKEIVREEKRRRRLWARKLALLWSCIV